MRQQASWSSKWGKKEQRASVIIV